MLHCLDPPSVSQGAAPLVPASQEENALLLAPYRSCLTHLEADVVVRSQAHDLTEGVHAAHAEEDLFVLEVDLAGNLGRSVSGGGAVGKTVAAPA
jgi:hypothetical protein